MRPGSFHEVVAPAQRRWRAACQQRVKGWKADGSLRPHLKEKTAVDLLWLHCGDDVYAGLVGEYGWGRQEVQRWIVETLIAQLFGPASSRCGDHT